MGGDAGATSPLRERLDGCRFVTEETNLGSFSLFVRAGTPVEIPRHFEATAAMAAKNRKRTSNLRARVVGLAIISQHFNVYARTAPTFTLRRAPLKQREIQLEKHLVKNYGASKRARDVIRASSIMSTLSFPVA